MHAKRKQVNEFHDNRDPNDKGQLLSGNCLTKTIFTFAVKVFRLGNQKPYTQDDCWGIEDDFCYGFNQDNFRRFQRKFPLRENSLAKIILRYILSRWIWIFMAFFTGNFASVVFPYLLRATIQWLDNQIKGTPEGRNK